MFFFWMKKGIKLEDKSILLDAQVFNLPTKVEDKKRFL